MDAFQEKPEVLEEKLNRLQNTGNRNLYNELKSTIQDHQTKPHQHNADYISKYELFWYLKSLGFSEVYFTQPYQSVSPALWEKYLNPIHLGFTYSIEAIK